MLAPSNSQHLCRPYWALPWQAHTGQRVPQRRPLSHTMEAMGASIPGHPAQPGHGRVPCPGAMGQCQPCQGQLCPPICWAPCGNGSSGQEGMAEAQCSSHHSTAINYSSKAISVLGSLACWNRAGKVSQHDASCREGVWGSQLMPLTPQRGPWLLRHPVRGAGLGAHPRGGAQHQGQELPVGPGGGVPYTAPFLRVSRWGAGGARGRGMRADAPRRLCALPAAGVPVEKGWHRAAPAALRTRRGFPSPHPLCVIPKPPGQPPLGGTYRRGCVPGAHGPLAAFSSLVGAGMRV